MGIVATCILDVREAKMTRYFVTSSGTEIGKTFVTSLLLRQAAGRFRAYKPIISGFDEANPADSDTAILLGAQQLPCDAAHIDMISPHRFAAPLSPHMAATLEDKTLDFFEVVSWCKTRPAMADAILFEGAGGVMVPINNTHTMRDIMQALGYNTILVVGSYLGSISHSLTAAQSLEQAGCAIQAIIVSESEHSTVSLSDTVSTLRQFLPFVRHIEALPRVKRWQDAPNLLHILL